MLKHSRPSGMHGTLRYTMNKMDMVGWAVIPNDNYSHGCQASQYYHHQTYQLLQESTTNVKSEKDYLHFTYENTGSEVKKLIKDRAFTESSV